MSITRHIPNLLTLFNLLCGCMAIISAFRGNLLWASYLVGMAAAADFLDGFAARVFGNISALGKQLDSLADMVSFGLVPSVIVFRLLEITRARFFSASYMDLSAVMHLDYVNMVLLLSPFLLALFAALRLAKFNTRPASGSFTGLPTPAMALFVASLPVILLKQINIGHVALPYDETIVTFHNAVHLSAWESQMVSVILNARVLVTVAVILALLMVSPIPMFKPAIGGGGWSANKVQFLFAAFSLVLLLLLQAMALPVIVTGYVLFSLVHNAIPLKS